MVDLWKVGASFVSNYYRQLTTDPAGLDKFYGRESNFTIKEISDQGEVVIGRDNIRTKLAEMNLQSVKVQIRSLVCQSSPNDGITSVVVGELSVGGGPSRRFSQTFQLARHAGNKFYLRNDCLCYTETVAELENQAQTQARLQAAEAAAQAAQAAQAQLQASLNEAQQQIVALQQAPVIVPEPTPPPAPVQQYSPPTPEPEPEPEEQVAEPEPEDEEEGDDQDVVNHWTSNSNSAAWGDDINTPTSQDQTVPEPVQQQQPDPTPPPQPQVTQEIVQEDMEVEMNEDSGVPPTSYSAAVARARAAGAGSRQPIQKVLGAPPQTTQRTPAPVVKPPERPPRRQEYEDRGGRDRGGRGGGYNAPASGIINKVFVQPVADDCTEADVKAMAKKYGAVTNVNLIKSKHIGFIEFQNADSVDKIVADARQQLIVLKEKTLMIEKARKQTDTNNTKDAGNTGGRGNTNTSGNTGGGGNIPNNNRKGRSDNNRGKGKSAAATNGQWSQQGGN